MQLLPKSLLAGLLSAAVAMASAQAGKASDQFVPTKLRSEYLRMPVNELSPMLDWLVGERATTARVSPLLIQAMILHGQNEQALSTIQAARSATDKAVQRDMLFFTEGLLAEARVKGLDAAQFTKNAAQRVAALPWPAARSRLKEVLRALDIPPFEATLAESVYSDPAYRLAPFNSPGLFAANIVETRFSGEILGPYAASLRAVIQDRLEHASSGPSYWQQRAYPPLPQQGKTVRVAVWEKDGVEIGLFKHPEGGCLVEGAGKDCLIDPQVDGMDRSRAWAFVKGMHDAGAGEPSKETRAWEEWQVQLAAEINLLNADPKRHEQLVKTVQHLGQTTVVLADALPRLHGTHVAGIIAQDNPFVELLAIRDDTLRAGGANQFRNVGAFLQANKVRVVNISWVTDVDRMPVSEVAIFEKRMKDLLSAFPDTLFVAAAGNDDNSIDTHRFLPAALSAPNLLTVGAVDQDGQVTFFTNVGGGVSLYANGDTVRSIGPTGYPLVMSGTSMAAPQVCNAAAKLLSQHPELSVAELKHLLIDGADELPAGDQLASPIRILNPARSAALGER